MIGEIIGWLIVGLIIGALARLLMPGRDPMGCLMTALLGVAGSVVGGFIGRLIWGAPRGTGYFTPSRSWWRSHVHMARTSSAVSDDPGLAGWMPSAHSTSAR